MLTIKEAMAVDNVWDIEWPPDMAPEVEELEEEWAGGVADLGSPEAAYAIQQRPWYDSYKETIIKHIRMPVTMYRSMSVEEYEELRHGSYLYSYVSFTFDKQLAINWRNLAQVKDKNRVVVAYDVYRPESIVMRGKAEEEELVLEADWISFHELTVIIKQ